MQQRRGVGYRVGRAKCIEKRKWFDWFSSFLLGSAWEVRKREDRALPDLSPYIEIYRRNKEKEKELCSWLMRDWGLCAYSGAERGKLAFSLTRWTQHSFGRHLHREFLKTSKAWNCMAPAFFQITASSWMELQNFVGAKIDCKEFHRNLEILRLSK